jgi:hypothetical protein
MPEVIVNGFALRLHTDLFRWQWATFCQFVTDYLGI